MITQAAFDKWKQQMEVYLAGNVGEMVLPTLELGLDTIETNYEDVITQTRDEFQSSLDEAFKMIEINPEEVNWFNKLWMELDQNFTITDGKAREGVSRLVAELSPTKEELESVRQQYVEAGKVPPAAITEGLNDIYALEQMSGAADNTLLLLAQSIAESEEKQQVLAQSILTGQEIDAELAQALRDNYGLVWDASAGMFVQIQEASFLSQAEVLEFMNTSGVAAGTVLATALSDEYGVVYNAATGLWEAVNAATAGTTATANASAKAYEVASATGTGYVEGANEQAGNVGEASSGLVEAGEQAFDEAEPGLVSQATETGTATGESFASGIESTEEEVDDSAATVARSAGDAMQDTVDGIVLDPPEMATPDWTSAAAQGRSGMQSYLNNNPLTVRVNQVTGSRVNYNAYAEGGIVDKREISLVGEAGAEAIIPLENNRARALDLWREAGERLNAFAAEQGRTVGSAVRERLVQQNEDNHREMHFAEGAVVIHALANAGVVVPQVDGLHQGDPGKFFRHPLDGVNVHAVADHRIPLHNVGQHVGVQVRGVGGSVVAQHIPPVADLEAGGHVRPGQLPDPEAEGGVIQVGAAHVPDGVQHRLFHRHRGGVGRGVEGHAVGVADDREAAHLAAVHLGYRRLKVLVPLEKGHGAVVFAAVGGKGRRHNGEAVVAEMAAVDGDQPGDVLPHLGDAEILHPLLPAAGEVQPVVGLERPRVLPLGGIGKAHLEQPVHVPLHHAFQRVGQGAQDVLVNGGLGGHQAGPGIGKDHSSLHMGTA